VALRKLKERLQVMKRTHYMRSVMPSSLIRDSRVANSFLCLPLMLMVSFSIAKTPCIVTYFRDKG